MRCCLVLLALLAAVVAEPQVRNRHAANRDFLKKQQDVIHLLQQMMQDIPNEELRQIGKNYNIEGNLQQYQDPKTVQYYVRMVKNGYIQPKQSVYTAISSELRKQVALLLRVLLSARDYTTFVKTAAWARNNVNEEQFAKAFAGAVLQRKDTKGIILPAPYEVFPNLFFNSRVIQKAQNIRSQSNDVGRTDKTVVINARNNEWTANPEGRLNYFTQDVGLGSYYSYVSMAGWLQRQQMGEDTNGRRIGRGSQYYYLHQQLLARYNFERLSNDLGPIVEADYTKSRAAFKPHLRYLNGVEFPGRANDIHFTSKMYDLIDNVWTTESRLKDAIDAGYVKTPQGGLISLYQRKGLDILGDLIEGTGRSMNPRYYGNLQATARQLLGGITKSGGINEQMPSALERPTTAIRDPAFYQLYQRILKIFKQYQDSLPSYQQQDLILPGVKIENIKIDKLVTYFDKTQKNINAATIVPRNKQQQGYVQIKAEFERLNHKPFEYQIVVQSDKQINGAVVRVYIGPKREHDGRLTCIERDRLKFVELDQFTCNLDTGRNVIQRNSQQAPGRSGDYPSMQTILKKINDAARSENPFFVTEPEKIYGFPERLALPKGWNKGLPIQLVVVISSPQQKEGQSYGPVVSNRMKNYQQQSYQVPNELEDQGQQQQNFQDSGEFQGIFDRFGGRKQQGNQRDQTGTTFQQYFGQNPFPQERRFIQDTQQRKNKQTWQVLGTSQDWNECRDSQNSQECINSRNNQRRRVNSQESQECGISQNSQECRNSQESQERGNYRISQRYVGSQESQECGNSQNSQECRNSQTWQNRRNNQDSQERGIFQNSRENSDSQESQENDNQRNQNWFDTFRKQRIDYITGIGQGSLSRRMNYQDDQQKLQEYFQDRNIREIIGGAVSLDGRPLGFPFERPLEHGALRVPNVKIIDVAVYHEKQENAENERY